MEDKLDMTETAAANTIQNILYRIGNFVYGTNARAYHQLPSAILKDIKQLIEEYERYCESKKADR